MNNFKQFTKAAVLRRTLPFRLAHSTSQYVIYLLSSVIVPPLHVFLLLARVSHSFPLVPHCNV